jgi:hypothetical protein
MFRYNKIAAVVVLCSSSIVSQGHNAKLSQIPYLSGYLGDLHHASRLLAMSHDVHSHGNALQREGVRRTARRVQSASSCPQGWDACSIYATRDPNPREQPDSSGSDNTYTYSETEADTTSSIYELENKILPCIGTSWSPLDTCVVSDWETGSGHCGQVPYVSMRLHMPCTDGSSCQARRMLSSLEGLFEYMGAMIYSAYDQPALDMRDMGVLYCNNSVCEHAGSASPFLHSQIGDPCLADVDCGPITSDHSALCNVATRMCTRRPGSTTCFLGQCPADSYCGDRVTHMASNGIDEGVCLPLVPDGSPCGGRREEMCLPGSFCNITNYCARLRSLPDESFITDIPNIADLKGDMAWLLPHMFTQIGMELCESQLLLPVTDTTGTIIGGVCKDPAHIYDDVSKIGTPCICGPDSVTPDYPIPNSTMWCLASGSPGDQRERTCMYTRTVFASVQGRQAYNDAMECASDAVSHPQPGARACVKGGMLKSDILPTCVGLACTRQFIRVGVMAIHPVLAGSLSNLLHVADLRGMDIPACLITAAQRLATLPVDALEALVTAEVNSYCQLPPSMRAAGWACTNWMKPSPSPSVSVSPSTSPSSSGQGIAPDIQSLIVTGLRDDSTSVGFVVTAIIVAVIASCVACFKLRTPGKAKTKEVLLRTVVQVELAAMSEPVFSVVKPQVKKEHTCQAVAS